jgi:hypothetical protein
MKAHRRRRGGDHLTMALDGGERLTLHPGCFTPMEKMPVPTEQETRWVSEHAGVHKQECLFQISSYVKTSHLQIVHPVLTNKDVDKPYP